MINEVGTLFLYSSYARGEPECRVLSYTAMVEKFYRRSIVTYDPVVCGESIYKVYCFSPKKINIGECIRIKRNISVFVDSDKAFPIVLIRLNALLNNFPFLVLNNGVTSALSKSVWK